MSSEHPPIPPKCPRLFKNKGGTFTFYLNRKKVIPLSNIGVPVFDDLSALDRTEYRGIIAAVAEVEWRKRAERWEAVGRGWAFRKPYQSKNVIYACADMERRALDNAAAWRAWGEEGLRK